MKFQFYPAANFAAHSSYRPGRLH